MGVGVREKERDREGRMGKRQTEFAGAVQAEGAIRASGARATGSYNCLEWALGTALRSPVIAQSIFTTETSLQPPRIFFI